MLNTNLHFTTNFDRGKIRKKFGFDFWKNNFLLNSQCLLHLCQLVSAFRNKGAGCSCLRNYSLISPITVYYYQAMLKSAQHRRNTTRFTNI